MASMIEVHALTKRYGDRTVVDDLTFQARPGVVTGFLGPNGAGKSTTMRMVLGLDRPSAGRATVNGKPFAAHPAPLREIGALLDGKAFHPGRSGRDHLLALAATHRLPVRRVDEVLDLVGLRSAARQRAGKYSLGMGQRLGIAAALLGDPKVVVLDEPVNGLDPEGVRWIRELLQRLAAEGRTVLVSSHLMSEMALTAQHVIVIGRGRLIADTSVDELTARAGRVLRVRSASQERLLQRLRERGLRVEIADGGALEVCGASGEEVGDAAFAAGVVLHELAPVSASLEDAFMALTSDAVDFAAGPGARLEVAA